MKYTQLGNSDLNVSRTCMGCMGFGDAKQGQHSWTADATKLFHVEGAAKALDLKLSEEEMVYLEEAYVPHRFVGGNGAEYSGGRKRKTCLVHRNTACRKRVAAFII